MTSKDKKLLSQYPSDKIDGFRDKIKTIFTKLESNNKNKTFLNECPPDEASEALGFQLGNELLSFLPTSPDDDKNHREFSVGGADILSKLLASDEDEKKLNTSVAHSYFDVLGYTLSSYKMRYDGSLMLSIWSGWIGYCEDVVLKKNHLSLAIEILTLLIRHYSRLVYDQIVLSQTFMSARNENYSFAQDKILESISLTYTRSSMMNTKKCLIREFTSMISMHEKKSTNASKKIKVLTIVLSPLASSCLLSSSSGDSSEELANLFVQCLMRQLRFLVSDKKNMSYQPNEWFHLFQWTTNILHFLMSSCTCDDSTISSNLELGHQFFSDLCDLMINFINIMMDRGICISDDSSTIFSTILECMLDKILPSFIHLAPHCHLFPLEYILRQLNSLISIYQEIQPTMNIILSEVTVFHLCALVLQTPTNTTYFLNILLSLVCCVDQSDKEKSLLESYNSIVIGSIFSIGCLFSYPSNRQAEAKVLRRHAINAIIRKRNNHCNSKTDDEKLESSLMRKSEGLDFQHIFQLFHDNRPHDEILQVLKFLSSVPLNQPCLSVTEQSELLLISLSLLVYSKIMIANNDESDFTQISMSFLGRILHEYAHLGIRGLPIIMVLMKISLDQNDIHFVAQALEFLTMSACNDPHCAHEIWNTLSSFTNPHTPINVQSMVIRLYPRLCSCNKRLMSRVINSLRTYVMHPNAELRLVSSITLCDMAKDDLIRDVSVIIGWIQSLLVDEEEMVVHFAILTLHYLVLNEELDFSIVVKVINKKLVNISDIQAVTQLNPTIIEALIIFLGDGENMHMIADTKDEDDSDDNETKISAQATHSIETLLHLALIPWFDDVQGRYEHVHDDSKLPIIEAIYSSLSKYSVKYLGLDQDLILSSLKTNFDDENDISGHNDDGFTRYQFLKRVVTQGFIISERITATKKDKSNALLLSVQKMAKRIILLEEHALGLSLWTDKNNSKTCDRVASNRLQQKVSKASKSALPTYAEMYHYYLENPSDVTAISSFLCFRVEKDCATRMDLYSILDDMVEMANDMRYLSDDPFIRVLSLQSWINSMREISRIIHTKEFKSNLDPLDIVGKILEWKEKIETPDVVFIALAAFSLTLPDPIHCSNANDLIYREVMGAHDDKLFEDENLECAAIGFLALKLIQSTSLSGAMRLVNFLESKQTKEHGNSCFEALFSLGFIVQALHEHSSTSTCPDNISCSTARMMMQRILLSIFSEINSLLKEPNTLFCSLIACLRVGVPTPDLLKQIVHTDIQILKMQEGSKERAKASCISLTLALPGLFHLDSAFIQATYCILMSLPWGYGKGLAIAAIIDLMEKTNIDTTEILDQIYNDCLHGIINTSDGYLNDDVYFVFAKIAEIYKIQYDDPKNSWFYRILHPQKGDNFNSSTTSTAILALSQTLGSISSFSGTKVTFYNHSILHSSTTKKKVDFFVKMMKYVVKNKRENENIHNSAILSLGIFSSMRYAETSEDNLFSPKEKTSSLSLDMLDTSSTNHYDVYKFPNAATGTLVNMILSRCKKKTEEIHLQRSTSFANSSALAHCLSCIKEIAIPGNITRCIDLLIRREDELDNMLKEVCVELIVTQASITRRATSDRQDYLKYYISMTKESPFFFTSIIGVASHVILSNIYKVAPFLTSKDNIDVVDRLWTISCSDVPPVRNFIISTLKSFKLILRHGQKQDTNLKRKEKILNKIPPAVVAKVQSLILNDSFRFMSQTILFLGDRDGSEHFTSNVDLWSIYLDCVTEIPFDVYERQNFFSFHTNKVCENISRVFIISHLGKQGILVGTMEQEFLRSISWIARHSLLFPDEKKQPHHFPLWLASFSLSTQSKRLSCEWKKDFISNFFESVHVNGIHSERFSQFAVEISLFVSSHRQKFGKNMKERIEVFHSLFSIFSPCLNNFASFFLLPKNIWNDFSILATNDVPKNLGLLCSLYNINSNMTNKAIRILGNEKEKHRNGKGNSKDFERILLACVDRKHSSIKYVMFASSLLTTC